MATYIASQTTIGYKASGGSEYTNVAQVASFSGPSFKVSSIETTNLSDAAKKYRPGISDSGEMQFDIRFDPADASHTALKGYIEDPEVLSWQVSFPTATAATLFTFEGFPTAFEITGGGPEDLIEASLTLQISGAVTVSTAS